MALSEERCTRIIEMMKSISVEDRLKAINEAKDENKKCFSDEMTDYDYARAAYFLETQYNLLREELKVKQIRVKADTGNGTVSTSSKSKTTASKTTAPKKKKPEPMDMKALFAEFAAFSAKAQAQKKED